MSICLSVFTQLSPTSRCEFKWDAPGTAFSKPPPNTIALLIDATKIDGSARILDENSEQVFAVGVEVENKGYQVLVLIEQGWELFTQRQVDIAWIVAT